MPALKEIEEQIMEVLTAYADTSDGIDPEEHEAFMSHVTKIIDDLNEKEAAKIDGYGHFVSRLEAEEKRLANIIKNLQNRKKGCACKIDSIKEHLLHTMKVFGKKKIEGNLFTARIGTSHPVEIFDEKLLTQDYLRFSDPVPDKTAIMIALKNDTEVPGARLSDKQNVTIK